MPARGTASRFHRPATLAEVCSEQSSPASTHLQTFTCEMVSKGANTYQQCPLLLATETNSEEQLESDESASTQYMKLSANGAGALLPECQFPFVHFLFAEIFSQPLPPPVSHAHVCNCSELPAVFLALPATHFPCAARSSPVTRLNWNCCHTPRVHHTGTGMQTGSHLALAAQVCCRYKRDTFCASIKDAS